MIAFTAAFGAGLILSLALTPAAKRLAIRTRRVARPKQDRWHSRVTPMFGGIAIAVSALVVGFVVNRTSGDLWPFLLGGLAIFGVGLVDDIIPLKPSTKLIAQIALASGFVFFGYRLHWVDSAVVDSVLTLIWLVGLTNAFNLLDNMDGLCAGIALVASVSLALAAGVHAPESLYPAGLAGVTLGFLVYNFHPASIFMGDSGSLFLGFSLAALTLRLPGAAAPPNILATVAAPLVVLLIPIFDTTLVTFSRLLNGRSPSKGGRDHASHRLVAIGLPERTAVTVLWGLAVLGGLVGWSARQMSSANSIVTISLLVLAMVVFAAYLAHVRVYDQADPSLRSGRITPFLIEFMHKRRVAEVLLDVLLVMLSYYAAYRLRFETTELSAYYVDTFLVSLPIVIGVQMMAFFIVGVYRGVWRHFSLMDGVVIAKGALLGTATTVMTILYLYRFENYSRTVFIIYALLLMALVSASRASFRLISEFALRRRAGRPLVIYGAGERGALVGRKILSDQSEYRLLGFIDDNLSLRTRVQGYPVLGGFDTLARFVRERSVEFVLVSVAELDGDRMHELERLCGQHKVSLLRLRFELEQLVGS